MSIVFEEVSGEITPERQPQKDTGDESAPEAAVDLDEQIRHWLQREQHRQARLSDR